MALDFSRYMDVPVEDLEAPRPLPAGTYFATVIKTENREVEFERGTKTPVATVSFRITAPDDDVDPDLLPEGGGAGRFVTRDYRLNDPERTGQWQLRRLGEETLGIPGKGKQLQDLVDDFPNAECRVAIVPRPQKEEGGPTYYNVIKVLPASTE